MPLLGACQSPDLLLCSGRAETRARASGMSPWASGNVHCSSHRSLADRCPSIAHQILIRVSPPESAL